MMVVAMQAIAVPKSLAKGMDGLRGGACASPLNRPPQTPRIIAIRDLKSLAQGIASGEVQVPGPPNPPPEPPKPSTKALLQVSGMMLGCKMSFWSCLLCGDLLVELSGGQW
eukprot:1137964-Pelagomonas_calceolata.AAC.4